MSHRAGALAGRGFINSHVYFKFCAQNLEEEAAEPIAVEADSR